MSTSAGLRRTALYDEHGKLGARLVPFAGFEMPVQYSSILKEHDAVRHRAGLFDLSHMGQFVLEGPNVAPWAETLTINAVESMKPMQARYNIFCNPQGGAHDDTIFYRSPSAGCWSSTAPTPIRCGPISTPIVPRASTCRIFTAATR